MGLFKTIKERLAAPTSGTLSYQEPDSMALLAQVAAELAEERPELGERIRAMLTDPTEVIGIVSDYERRSLQLRQLRRR